MKLLGFTETHVFTKKIVTLLTDDRLAELQIFLCENPDFGKLVKGSGGLRKVRWSDTGKGKSGGIRVIYYWAVSRDKIVFLDVYSKSEKDDLTEIELRTIRRIAESFK